MNEERHKPIENFVRKKLGCTCPQEVFRNIEVVRNPEDFAAFSPDYSINLGGRLLVLVLRQQNLEKLSKKLQKIFSCGKSIRNERGFNRFRLVVPVTRNSQTEMVLDEKFQRLENLDDRLHLHTIDAELIPGIDG